MWVHLNDNQYATDSSYGTNGLHTGVLDDAAAKVYSNVNPTKGKWLKRSCVSNLDKSALAFS